MAPFKYDESTINAPFKKEEREALTTLRTKRTCR